MVPESALVEDQLRVMFCPETSEVGDAVNCAVGTGPLPPPGPLDEAEQLASTMQTPKSRIDDFALPRKQRQKEFPTSVKVPIVSSILLLVCSAMITSAGGSGLPAHERLVPEWYQNPSLRNTD